MTRELPRREVLTPGLALSVAVFANDQRIG